MKIVWDENERRSNLDKHRLDFADLDDAFFERAIIRPVRLGRYSAMGRLADGTIIVIFVHLGTEGLSIISMRQASRRERRAFE